MKVLVGDVQAGTVQPVWETSTQTRLGRGFYQDHRLQPEPIAATALTVARYARDAVDRGAETVRVIATSAARDAINRDELLDAIRAAAGLETEVLSGESEAELGFLGVTSHPAYADHHLLVLDVGGGSTEFIVGANRHLDLRQSFPLGSVRLLERFPPSDPPLPRQREEVQEWLADFLAREVAPVLDPSLAQGEPPMAVGIGGTTAILALMQAGQRDFLREQVEAARFSPADLDRMVRQLWELPLAQRRQLPGLPPERADVILMGSAIYAAVLQAFGLPELRVSTRGLRFAALLSGTPL